MTDFNVQRYILYDNKNKKEAEGKKAVLEQSFCYTTEIKLLLIGTSLFQAKLLIVVPRVTTKKITKKYIVKEK